MKQVMNYHKDNGLLNMIRRTDPMIMEHHSLYLIYFQHHLLVQYIGVDSVYTI